MHNYIFVINSLFLGIGLAMDAFSISLADGLAEPRMKTSRMLAISGVFAFFQAFMPMTGWICVHTVVVKFAALQKFIPWIALGLLGYIGGKMLFEGLRKGSEETVKNDLSVGILILQGIATSIDALSVGFTISDYNIVMALISALIIATVTFIICNIGIVIGRYCGTKLANKASIFGGCILIFIAIEVFITGYF